MLSGGGGTYPDEMWFVNACWKINCDKSKFGWTGIYDHRIVVMNKLIVANIG